MKRFIILVCLLLPIMAVAQELPQESPEKPVKKHHFEAGAGLAIPNEFVVSDASKKEANALSLYGEYRYNLTQSLAIGAVYSFVLPHVSREYEFLDSPIQDKSMFHTLNAIVEYRFGTLGPMSMYVGGGAGMQFRNVQYGVITSTPTGFFSTDISLHLCLEFFNSLRITFGHYHDLHYPIAALPAGAPYYHISVGWSF